MTVAPGVVGRDDGPALAEVLVGPGRARRCQSIRVGAGAEAVARALLPGCFGRFAGRKVDRLELGHDGDGGQHDAGVNRAGHEGCAVALNQRSQLAGAGGRIGLGVLGHQLELAAGDAAPLVDELGGCQGAFVVPIAPRCESAGQLAMVANDDRPARLRKCRHAARQRNVGRTAGERGVEEAAAVHATPFRGRVISSLRHCRTPFEDLRETPRYR